MGAYYNYFYGNQHSDPALIAGKPQSIRGDEWLVNTQRTIAQKNDSFASVNKNIGNGEDETLMSDVPTNNWSAIFKPHNLGFFVFSFDNAFALRWWIMSYLLILGCYFFILILLPGKRLFASLLSLAMLFSPFIQWWYLYGTLGSIYYCLFGAVVFTKLIHSKKRIHASLWAILLAYIATCFILILYPPFQIPCALVLIAFAIGYLFDNKKRIDKKKLRRNLIYFMGSIILSLSIVGLFVYQKYDIIKTIQDTSYPGQRVIKSGGYSAEHLLSSNLSPVFQSGKRANAYLSGNTNQSESSNFILLIPFLLIPALYISYKKYRKDKKNNYLLLSSVALLIIILAWLFIPGLDILGKLTLLDKVPLERLLIGLGLLNFIFITIFIKIYNQAKERFSIALSVIYSLLIVILYLIIDFNVMVKFPNFIGYKYAIIFSLPFAMIIYCFMRKHFKTAISGLLLFALLSTFHINPIYQGTAILTKTPLSRAIQEIGKSNNKKWISDDGIMIENFATMNGEGSLTGVYMYPQLELWEGISTADQEYIYNRYAHVNFNLDRNKNETIEPSLILVNRDQLNVKIEPCDTFFIKNNVGFLITSKQLKDGEATCTSLIRNVKYPSMTFYIYSLN
jgi:hypothetical protein